MFKKDLEEKISDLEDTIVELENKITLLEITVENLKNNQTIVIEKNNYEWWKKPQHPLDYPFWC